MKNTPVLGQPKIAPEELKKFKEIVCKDYRGELSDVQPLNRRQRYLIFLIISLIKKQNGDYFLKTLNMLSSKESIKENPALKSVISPIFIALKGRLRVL